LLTKAAPNRLGQLLEIFGEAVNVLNHANNNGFNRTICAARQPWSTRRPAKPVPLVLPSVHGTDPTVD